jgi:hypothetical protein
VLLGDDVDLRVAHLLAVVEQRVLLGVRQPDRRARVVVALDGGLIELVGDLALEPADGVEGDRNDDRREVFEIIEA